MSTSETGLRAQRLAYTDSVDRISRPVLVWRFDPPARVVSSAVLGGGIGLRTWAVNAEVALEYGRSDPREHLIDIAEGLGLSRGSGVGLLTAASVFEVVSTQDGTVTCDATVGLHVPTWAASDGGPDQPWLPGTINLVCHVPAPLCDAALVNAVITATEAKSQALLQIGVGGTGTASDAVLITCPPGESEPFGGPRSTWGARLARAVHAAVSAGTVSYLERQR